MTTAPEDRDGDRSDDDLRALLRRADPLADRDPRLDPASLEVLMSELTDTTRPAEHDRHDVDGVGPVGRRRRRWVVPAIGAAAAAAVLAFTVPALLPAGSDDPVVSPTRPAVATGLVLTVPSTDPLTASCMALSPELLAPAQVAFDGTVASVDGTTAVLTPTRWYRGERAGAVEVTVPREVDVALVGAPRFEVGGRYLVAGGEGQVALCGATGAWSPELEAVYRAAFPG